MIPYLAGALAGLVFSFLFWLLTHTNEENRHE